MFLGLRAIASGGHSRYAALACAALLGTGCTALLGDFSNGGADAGPEVKDAGGSSSGSSGGSSSGSGSGSSSGSGGGSSSGAADAAMQPEASAASLTVPGKPGFDITSGGNTSVSINYKLVGAVGESGSNVVTTSTNYTLHGGVIVGTQ